MKCQIISALALALTLLATTGEASAASASKFPTVQPAVDGVLQAFESHAVVALGDEHEGVQANAFYIALLSDPRFARQVGNVVIETAGAAHQDILDRYMAGDAVPYAELRKIWLDVVGWYPGVTGGPQFNFFAAVRAVNMKLPPDQRIRVWGGEPFVDWSKIQTNAEFRALYQSRDQNVADLVHREILAKGKKTLVIYGSGHFFPANNMNGKIEEGYPKSVFVIVPYIGSDTPACDTALETRASGWPLPALVSNVRASWVGDLLGRPGCENFAVIPEGPTPPTPAQVAAAKRDTETASGLNADAIVYYGPAASILYANMDPFIFLDQDYFDELSRRYQIQTGRPFDWSLWVTRNSRAVAPMEELLQRAPVSPEAAQRMKANRPEPGSGAALRKHIRAVQADHSDDESLTSDLVTNLRKTWPATVAAVNGWGAMKSLAFSHVDNHGYDVYEVGFEHAKSTWTIHLTADGKISSLDHWLHP